ncbi:MAG: segregation/condensation protein A [Ignavibacteria bacterium]|jgi:segregation and condensation protein A|nr:segregation/condensation protein A [Ignavibacteria bacterium]
MYKIVLPNFEGPYDLLLYFIKRDELNIFDLPISKIAFEFLNYIKLMNFFDIELAGDFIVMTANLLYLKTQMLLPRPQTDDDAEDPRTPLMQNIYEIRQFKEAARNLAQYASENKFFLYRHNYDADLANANMTADYKNATLYNLMKAYGNALNRKLKPSPVHIVSVDNVTVEDKIEEINARLLKNKRFTFSQFVLHQNRRHIIAAFLALLELMRLGKIFITQESPFAEITISEVPGSAA